MTTSFKSLRDADMLRGGSLDESSSMSVLFGIELRDALVRSLGVDKKAEHLLVALMAVAEISPSSAVKWSAKRKWLRRKRE